MKPSTSFKLPIIAFSQRVRASCCDLNIKSWDATLRFKKIPPTKSTAHIYGTGLFIFPWKKNKIPSLFGDVSRLRYGHIQTGHLFHHYYSWPDASKKPQKWGRSLTLSWSPGRKASPKNGSLFIVFFTRSESTSSYQHALPPEWGSFSLYLFTLKGFGKEVRWLFPSTKTKELRSSKIDGWKKNFKSFFFFCSQSNFLSVDLGKP